MTDNELIEQAARAMAPTAFRSNSIRYQIGQRIARGCARRLADAGMLRHPRTLHEMSERVPSIPGCTCGTPHEYPGYHRISCGIFQSRREETAGPRPLRAGGESTP